MAFRSPWDEHRRRARERERLRECKTLAHVARFVDHDVDLAFCRFDTVAILAAPLFCQVMAAYVFYFVFVFARRTRPREGAGAKQTEPLVGPFLGVSLAMVPARETDWFWRM